MSRLFPRSQWLTIGKSNLLFQSTKDSKEPHLSESWHPDCQLDEQWFDLSADLLRKALAITPVNPAHPFELPPSGDTVIDFVNELGYPEPERLLAVTNPDTQFCKCCRNVIKHCIMQADMGRVYSRDPEQFFSQQSNATKSSAENPNKTPTTTTPVKQTKPAPPPSKKPSKRKLPQKVRKGKPVFQLVDPKKISSTRNYSSKEKDMILILNWLKVEYGNTSRKGEEKGVKKIRDPVSEATPKLHESSERKGPLTKQKVKQKPAAPKEDKDQGEERLDHRNIRVRNSCIIPSKEVSSSKPSLLVTPPPINTEATTITTSLPEITPFIALQLRVARLEQEMSEVKKTDHSADVLASIRSQVPTAVDNYLGTKLDDALLKNQESEKSPKEIIRAKKEQDEEKQDSTYSIRSTDKVDLEEFDLKSALFSHMNKKKSANKNTTNYRLYHALMEALIADEDAMDKEVADNVKDHKRKHDSDDDEDDDDDEGPSAGSNQGRSTKKRRSDSAASGSAKPPPKDDDQSSKKPRESEASASKQHPLSPQLEWQIN
ncbi:hypothetical protein Tco_0915388 [Tanacetum coccineum]